MPFYENFVSLCNSIHKAPTAAVIDIGLERSSVTRWKRGGQPSDATLRRVADYFGTTVEELLRDQRPAENGALMECVTTDEQQMLRLLRALPEERRSSAVLAIEVALRSQGLL